MTNKEKEVFVQKLKRESYERLIYLYKICVSKKEMEKELSLIEREMKNMESEMEMSGEIGIEKKRIEEISKQYRTEFKNRTTSTNKSKNASKNQDNLLKK